MPLLAASDTEPPEAAREMFALLYQELRRLAHSRLACGGRHTLLDTAALVNEAFIRMQRLHADAPVDRAKFLAYVAATMRSIIVDFARRRSADRRGGDAEHVTLSGLGQAQWDGSDDDVLALHKALGTLAKIAPQLVQLVEMRYFVGLTDVEIGAAMGITDRTVRRQWERARLLLAEMLSR